MASAGEPYAHSVDVDIAMHESASHLGRQLCWVIGHCLVSHGSLYPLCDTFLYHETQGYHKRFNKMICMADRLTSEELKKLRTDVYRLKQEEFADILGVNRGAYKNWELPNRSVPEHIAELISQLRATGKLKRPPILESVANAVTYPTQPMRYAGALPAGDWCDPFESDDFEEVEARYFKTNRWCARIVGMSCFPALQPGDFCIFERNLAPQFGKIVVAQNGDHEATIKQLVYDSEKGVPVLHAINPDHDDAVSDKWGAVAILVCVTWVDDDGGEVSFYRPEGIKPAQLMRYRDHR